MSQVYMTAKLNLADGTILYPQVSLDNIVASISDPTLVSVATTTNGKVPVTELPVVTVVGDTGSNNNIPTEAAVRALADTKQNTLVAGTGTEIINGSTINAMAVNLNDVVVNNVPNNGLYLEVEGNTMSVVGALAANGSAGVIAGASDGVKLVDGVAQFDVTSVPKKSGDNAGVLVDVGDGLLVADGTASANISDVDGVLTDDWPVTGTNNYAGIPGEIVTPHNLRGALSVGQAVDVSCNPVPSAGQTNFATSVSIDDGTTWISTTSDGYKTMGLIEGEFVIERASAAAGTNYVFGWHLANFPKYASGLKYLLLCDVKAITGTMSFVFAQGTGRTPVAGVPYSAQYITSDAGYIRIATTVSTSNPYLMFSGMSAGNIRAYIKNWRQYEVTALTDEAIAYIAQLPDPDAFFRSTSVYSLRDKYLVKQDMVCPWIFTINMGDDSDLTVGAGLSYKIKYVDDSKPHNVTVDTIPTDAYGWDAHIQMFVKGASRVIFQPPLALMQPLTSNAGHNLTVKFRNGQALVYVDDLNAGYLVVKASGTDDGTLPYFLTLTPEKATDSKYIIFGGIVDGVTCDFGTVTPVYGSQTDTMTLIGNGMDTTTISGTLEMPNTKTMVMQDLAITGSTITGSNGITLDNVKLDSCYIPILGVTVNAGYVLDIPVGSTVTSEGGVIYGDGTLNVNGRLVQKKCFVRNITGDGSGVIDGNGTMPSPVYASSATGSYNYSNITITGGSSSNSGGGAWLATGVSVDVTFTNCVFRDNEAKYQSKDIYIGSPRTTTLNNCQFYDTYPINMNWQAENLLINNCTFHVNNNLFSFSGAVDYTYAVHGTAQFSGINKLNGHCAWNNVVTNIMCEDMYFLKNCELDFTDYYTDWPTGGAFMSYERYVSERSLGQYIYIGDNVTIHTKDGRTATVDAIKVRGLYTDGKIENVRDGIMTIQQTAANPWKANNITFASAIDASSADTVRLTGTTFTAGGCISKQPGRIHLPSASTNYVSDSTVASGIELLWAPIIVVGGNVNTPGGTSYIQFGSAAPTGYSGFGTYIKADGTHDFRAASSNYVISTEDATGAGSFLSALTSAVSAESSQNKAQFVQFTGNVTNVSAALTDATTVKNITIIDKSYNPLLYGNYTIPASGSMSIDLNTKQLAITGATTSVAKLYIPVGYTLTVPKMVTSGSKLEIWGGGTLDMNHTTMGENISGFNTTVTGVAITNAFGANGGIVQFSGGNTHVFRDCTITGCTATKAGGALYFLRNNTVTVERCVLTGNTFAGGVIQVRGTGTYRFTDCVITGNTTTGYAFSSADLYLVGTSYVENCVVDGVLSGAAQYIEITGGSIGTIWTDTDTRFVLGGQIKLGKIVPADASSDWHVKGGTTEIEFSSDSPAIPMNQSNTGKYIIVETGSAVIITKYGTRVTLSPGVYTSIADTGVATGDLAHNVSSANASGINTLYNILTSGTLNAVVFNRYLGTIQLPATTITRTNMKVFGCGYDVTTVNVTGTLATASNNTFGDMTITGSVASGNLVASDAGAVWRYCKFTNCSAEMYIVRSYAGLYNRVDITGCTSDQRYMMYCSGNITFNYINVTNNDGYGGQIVLDSSSTFVFFGATFNNPTSRGNKAVISTSVAGTRGGVTANFTSAFFYSAKDCVDLVNANDKASFSGSTVVSGTIHVGGTLTLTSGAVLDFRGNSTYEVPVTAGTITIMAGATVTVKPYGGGADIILSGGAAGLTGTQITRTGVLS